MNIAEVKPFWVQQHMLFGSRLTALVEECNALNNQLLEALCKNDPLPEYLIKRLEDLTKASMDAYGFSYLCGSSR